MPAKYHNLEGWMRDVRRAITGGDQIAYELAELFLDIDELVDPSVPMAAGSEDDADDTPDDNQDGVDGEHEPGREADAPHPRGHDARSASVSTPSSGLGSQLDLVPGSVGTPTQPGLAEVRTRLVGSPMRRMMMGERRLGAMPEEAD